MGLREYGEALEPPKNKIASIKYDNGLADVAKKKLIKNKNLQSIQPEKTTTPKQPLITYQSPSKSALEPVNVPTLEDFIKEAEKIAEQKVAARATALRRDTGDIAETFARKLYGQNVGATSGVGQELTARAIEDQAERLEPYAMQTAADLAHSELDYRQSEALRESQLIEQKRQNLYQGVLQGTIDKSQLSQDDLAGLGITDPQAVRTLQEVDFRNAMIGEGLNPDSPDDINMYTEQLRTSKKDTMRAQIIAGYSEANNGQLPTSEEVDMLLMLYGGETGILTAEEEAALIAKYNNEQWQRAMEMARAMNPPEGKVLCTELHRQGLISDEVYRSDMIVGRYYSIYHPAVVAGYHAWAIPFTRLMAKSKILTYIIYPFVSAWANHMHYKVTGKNTGSLLGAIIENLGVKACSFIGIFFKKEEQAWLQV